MNKFYIIFPIALLGGFLVVYKTSMKEMNRVAAEKAAIAQAETKAKEEERARIDKEAAEDAKKRQAEREAKEVEKQEKIRKDKEANAKALKDETQRYLDKAAAANAEAEAVEKSINDMRSKKEKFNRDLFDVAREVELAKVERHRAEMELQRLYGMVSSKVGGSFLTRMPPPPPAKK